MKNAHLFWIALLCAVVMAFMASMVACGDDDDDDEDADDDSIWPDDDVDDDTEPDDDTDEPDDDTEVDDDTEEPDDDTEEPDDDMTCDEVVNEFFFECQISLSDMNGDQLDDLGLLEWCGISEDFVSGGKTESPFWNCLGEASFDNCNQDAMDLCLDPAGAGGCTDTVDEIYACSITWVFTGDIYWIPEADMAATCDLLDWPWDCFQACADASCPDNTDDALACMAVCSEE
jgi:hypothetical protein